MRLRRQQWIGKPRTKNQHVREYLSDSGYNSPLMLIIHLDGVAFNGNSTFALKVHVVQYLVLHFTTGYCTGKFQKPVSQSTFTMINMGNNTKIPDIFQPD